MHKKNNMFKASSSTSYSKTGKKKQYSSTYCLFKKVDKIVKFKFILTFLNACEEDDFLPCLNQEI